MNKYAILVECNPPGTADLGGSCERDLVNMRKQLLDCGFLDENIICLYTKIEGKYGFSCDLFKVFDDIIQKSPEKVVILISGHGFQVRDTDGDEIDGFDECINLGKGIVLDDHLYKNIVLKAPKSCTLVLLTDTCSSGTLFNQTILT